ncbi:MAG: hypothetical protein CVV58_02570 [Tenericutes bacterium HGW-Tenericutes-3]|nr:MAG: hypothetical protein CVV58_02570 [Tenericutes bacterium HGW-Tenericutes-3]
MRLSDVLKLPKQPHSLSIIKDFLEKPLSHLDYQAAFSYYFEIAIELELYDLVYQEGDKVLKEVSNQSDSPYIEKILKHIIKASIKLEKFEKARIYIDQRRELLTILKQYLAVLDEIEYKKAIGLPYLEDLMKVLKDIVPDQVRIYCLEEMFIIYKNDHQYEMALNSLYELYKFDLESKYFNEELKLLVILKKHDQVIKKALNSLRGPNKNPHAVLALLEVYIDKEDYHKASTLEAEYEELIDNEDEHFKKKAYDLIVTLYKKMDNKPSVDYYQKKLKTIQRVLDKKVKPVVEEKPEIVVIEKAETKSMKHEHILEHLEMSHDLIQFSHLIDEKLLLRDYLRVFFMHVDSYVKTKEFIVYLKGETPNFFHYKKERLYDKTIIDGFVTDTIIDRALINGEEIVEEAKTIRWNKNIITQKDFEEDIKFIYSFPLGDIGAFAVYMDYEVTDPGNYYDIFKLVSAILFAHILDEKKLSRIKTENRFYENVLNSPILAYREHRENRSTYNDEAQTLFNIDKHYHLELFLRDVSYEHIHLYKEAISRLLNKSGETREIRYRYQEKNILEKMYSLKIGDEHVIMSLFFDQTQDVKDAKELIEKATVDSETGLSNAYALSLELEDLLKDKASLILIELDQDLKHIYGSEKMSHYFKEFAQHTKKFFNEGTTYRYDYNQILVIIPFNDIRSVTKTVKDYIKYLDAYESKILKYERFNANMGILRYPVVTVEKQMDKLLRYLDIALEKAKREREEKYEFFVFRDYEDELFEQQVIDHLNVAIENQDLGLIFNQITDIKKNRVWQYESELVMFNLAIDSRYLLTIAKKRNRLADLERFHIKKVCEFLVELEKETERLIKLTIPVSRETFLDPTFNPYILGLFKKYGIPYEFIRLKCDMDLRAKHYQAQIQELIDHGISLDTTSLEMALSYPFNALHVDLKKENLKYNSYLHKMKELLEGFQMALVVRGVKTKDQKESLELLGINYVEGSIYKQLPAPTLIKKIKESL